MGKQLTNKQLMEGFGYALGKAEGNINKAISSLENERKKIEAFSVDTEEIDKMYIDANERFKETMRVYASELKKMQEVKPKWLRIKDWLLVGALVLLFLISAVFSVSSYYKLNDTEQEKAKIERIATNLVDFFEEHPKEKKAFEDWNKKRNLP